MNTIKKFYADWCNPCKTLSTMLEGIKEELNEKGVGFEDVNADDHPDMMADYGIRGLPAIVMVNEKDEVIRRHSGLITKANLLTWA